ncbi:MAG: peptide ABC transporter ATP-binding protein, partial [Mesorhizobium sp.]
GHMSLCWLSDDVLAKMEPVIKFDKEHAAHEGVPDDAPHGDGPGFAGTPPKRPRGKTGSAAADAVGQAAEEAEAVSKARRHEVRDEVSETGRSPKPGKPRKPN